MSSPDPHDHDHDHAGHDHDHDHDHAGHDHPHDEAAPAIDPAKYEGLSGYEVRPVTDVVQEVVAALPRERFDAMVESEAKRLARKVTIRGFRPGHVPVSRVKQLYGDDIRRQALESLVDETWRAAVKEKGLRAVTSPKLTELEFEQGPVRFTLRFESLPMIEIQGLDSLTITPKSVRVTAEDIEAEIQNIRQMRARLVDSDASEANAGDFAVIHLMRWPAGGAREGEPEETREDLVVEVGNERNIAELDRALVGMRIGEARDFEAEVQTGGDPPTARAAFRVMLKQVRKRELPELDLDLVNSLGIGSFVDLDTFRAEVRRRMSEHRTEMARREQEAEAMEQLMRRNEFGIPPSLVESEAEERLKRGVAGLVQRGVDVENANIDWSAEIARVREHATKDLRADWLIELAAQAKNVQVSDADVEKEIEAIARERGMAPAAVRSDLEKSKQMSNLRASIRRRRTLDLLRSGATISVE